MSGFASIPDVCDVDVYRGADAPDGAAPDLLIEVPHGATRAADFARLAARLHGPFPDGLQDFFFVNTDVGAPEVAVALAQALVAAEADRTALVVRCLLPRTFVDCNRVIDAGAAATASAAGGVTPGIVEYVRDAQDLALLLSLHGTYADLVARAFDAVCGAGGLGLMLHSYAPREVDVPVDERIVERLRAAYAPETVETWPLRAEADLITRDPEGRRLADPDLVAAVTGAFRAAGLDAREGATYALSPSTMAYRYADRHPHRTLCLELRRDLLVKAFTPFSEMPADPARADAVGRVLAAALRAYWAARALP